MDDLMKAVYQSLGLGRMLEEAKLQQIAKERACAHVFTTIMDGTKICLYCGTCK